jgi:glycine oxidase
MSADVIVVGGGVVGCCVAFELATRHGAKVTVLERAVPGAEASSAAAGILGAQIEAHGEPLPRAVFELMLASRERHAWLDARLHESLGLGTGFRRCGVLKASMGDDLERLYGWQRARDVRLTFLDGDEARRLEPALARTIASAVHFPDEAQVDPPQLLRALQQGCAAAGVRFEIGTIVSGVARVGGRVAGVDVQDGRLEAAAVVVAAGSWSSMLSGLPDDLRRVRPVRGQIVQVDTRPAIARNIVFGDRGYVVTRPDGRTLLGATMEEVGHVKEVTAGGVAAVLNHALELMPALAAAPITATWCGFRPATREERPLIGAIEPGLFVATGHHRNGVLLAPETARLVADLVGTGRADRDLTPFAPR